MVSRPFKITAREDKDSFNNFDADHKFLNREIKGARTHFFFAKHIALPTLNSCEPVAANE